MIKRFVLLLLLVLNCSLPILAQSAGTGRTTRPAPAPGRGPVNSTGSPGVFQTAVYRVTVDSVHRKANNYTVTLVFENLSENVVKLSWGGLLRPNNLS